MTRFRWAMLLAIAGVLVVGGMAMAQDSADVSTGGAGAQDGAEMAAARAARAEQARLGEIQADREGTISELMGLWAPSRGASQLEVALQAASARELLQVSRAGSFNEVERILLGEAAGAPFGDVLPNALGDTDQDYVYTPVTPCRIFDTRNVGGTIATGASVEFYVYGATDISGQGGDPAGCAVPSGKGEPRGVHLNLTVVPATGQGNVRVYPADVATPTSSSINFKVGTNIANALTVKTYVAFGPKEIEVYVGGAGTADVLADVLGYYYEATVVTSSSMANVSGTQAIPDGTKTTVIFGSENHDLGADYNNTTGIFTVPATGLYNVSCHLQYGPLPASLARVNIYLRRNTGNLAVTFGDNDANNQYMPRMVSGTWMLTAGDTIYCQAFLNGGAANVTSQSYFSVTQVP